MAISNADVTGVLRSPPHLPTSGTVPMIRYRHRDDTPTTADA